MILRIESFSRFHFRLSSIIRSSNSAHSPFSFVFIDRSKSQIFDINSLTTAGISLNSWTVPTTESTVPTRPAISVLKRDTVLFLSKAPALDPEIDDCSDDEEPETFDRGFFGAVRRSRS